MASALPNAGHRQPLGILSIRNLLECRVGDLSRELEPLEAYVSNDGPGG
jgi:hypothetical protein